jgi:hypothetical protein
MLSAMDRRPDDLDLPDQQPIGRVVGKRQSRPIGVIPDARARAAMTANARYRTRAPKGIFFLSALPDHAARELISEPDIFGNDKRYALRINDEFTIDVMPSIGGHSWEAMRKKRL